MYISYAHTGICMYGVELHFWRFSSNSVDLETGKAKFPVISQMWK